MGKISYKIALVDFSLMLANQNFHLNDGGGGDCLFLCTGIILLETVI